jgi:hypothetical protein
MNPPKPTWKHRHTYVLQFCRLCGDNQLLQTLGSTCLASDLSALKPAPLLSVNETSVFQLALAWTLIYSPSHMV